MFIKIITVYGFLGAWIAYFICYAFYLNGMIKHYSNPARPSNIDTFLSRIFGIYLMNIVTAFVVVIFPVILLFLNILPYWIVVSVFASLVIYIVILYLMKKGEYELGRNITRKEVQEANKYELTGLIQKKKFFTFLFWWFVLIHLGVYLILPLDAWDIVPLTSSIFPTFMPIYLYILLDWVKIGILIMGYILLLLIAQERFKWTKRYYILKNPVEVKERLDYYEKQAREEKAKNQKERESKDIEQKIQNKKMKNRIKVMKRKIK